MSSATLTSLAMLKVNIDQGGDYLDYLRPFILHVLVDQKPDPVTERGVVEQLRLQFGLEIPARAVQVVLKRLAKRYALKKSEGVYRITGNLPNPGIVAKKSTAERHIQAIVSGLIEFSNNTIRPLPTDQEAVTATCAFLEEFNIPCLRAYLRGTAIPTVTSKHKSDIVLVSRYVLHLQQTDPQRFDSFLVMVQGHMLANALLCPDLQNAPKTYKGMTFYLDTPLLVQRLDLEGEPKKAAVETLICLLRNLGATVATFSHSREELERVIKGAATYVDSPDGHGAIIGEARRNSTTKSDLLLLAGQVDDKLSEYGIEVKTTPKYEEEFQIDEMAFKEVLDDEVSYYNPRAKEYDINSVRSIYVLRRGTSPAAVERCRAVLVSSNSGFARAAFLYGQRHEESREVSTVITDFSLANMAWLKAPMGAPNIPTTEILAFSYAALQPSKALLDKYLMEIDKLEKQGKITERDHQLLRSSTLAEDELMRLTLGDDEALTEETVTETLQRVSSAIKKEEGEKLTEEQEAHRRTQEDLVALRAEKKQIQERVYWRSRQRSRRCSWAVFGLIGVLLLAGLFTGLGFRASNQVLGLILIAGSGTFLLMTLINLFFGTTVRDLHQQVQKRLLTWFIKREVVTMGLDLSDFQ